MRERRFRKLRTLFDIIYIMRSYGCFCEARDIRPNHVCYVSPAVSRGSGEQLSIG
jgi:hypothetical protein